jgi:hypothetical protein
MSPPAAALAPAPATRRARASTARASTARAPAARSTAAALPARGLTERPRRPLAPSRPRRVSGPARSRAIPARRREGIGPAIALAAVGLCEHRLLDRVVRGRAWIALVTFALLGIVTLQLGLLQLNGSIGRALQRKAQLLRENTALSIENSTLAADEHVMSGATQAGMVPVPINSLRFLDARNASTGRAAQVLRAPATPPATSESQGASGATGTGASTTESEGSGASQSSSSSSSESSATSSGPTQSAATSAPQSSEASTSAASGESGASAAPSPQGTEAASSESGGSSSGGTGGG